MSPRCAPPRPFQALLDEMQQQAVAQASKAWNACNSNLIPQRLNQSKSDFRYESGYD